MQLKLDKKMVRKGKPVGLPYIGSKKKISKKIVALIKQHFGTDFTVYDIFGGGGAMTAELMINGFDVKYNEKNKDVADMFITAIKADNEYLKTLLVSRDEFYKIRAKEKKTVTDNLKLLINSFGNNSKNYLYAREKADFKYEAALEILDETGTWKNYKQSKTYKQKMRQLERLQQLEQLQQLQQLEVTTKDYKAFSDVEGAFLYLDPPYENANKYKFDFDSQTFYDWAIEMSKKNIVLISSYEISDSRFCCVHEFKTARSTLSGGTTGTRTEKLFMVERQAEQLVQKQLSLF